MALLGLVLAGQAETGSLAAGAKLAGVTTFCAGLAGPMRGRLLDRGELRSGLQRNCFLTCGLFSAFALCVSLRVPIIILYVLCVCLGYSFSGIWGGFRALLVVAVTPDHLRRSHFVESFMVEASWGIGPLVVTVLAALGGAVAALLGIAAVAFLAGISLIGVVQCARGPVRARTSSATATMSACWWAWRSASGSGSEPSSPTCRSECPNMAFRRISVASSCSCWRSGA